MSEQTRRLVDEIVSHLEGDPDESWVETNSIGHATVVNDDTTVFCIYSTEDVCLHGNTVDMVVVMFTDDDRAAICDSVEAFEAHRPLRVYIEEGTSAKDAVAYLFRQVRNYYMRAARRALISAEAYDED